MDQFEQLNGRALDSTLREQKTKENPKEKNHLETKWPLSID